MSEQRKRWDDEDVRENYAPCDAEGNLCRQCAAAIRIDHDQAREDRKRLAERLRKITKFGRGHDDECLYWYDGSTPPGCDCQTGRLLAEVDPQ